MCGEWNFICFFISAIFSSVTQAIINTVRVANIVNKSGALQHLTKYMKLAQKLPTSWLVSSNILINNKSVTIVLGRLVGFTYR